MRSVVEVSGLRAVAGDRTLVAELSFTVAAGEVLALVGESGSGKTTTGLALLGEARPGIRLTGEITVDGLVGYVPQHPAAALNPARRVGGVLTELAGGRRRDGAERVAEAVRAAQLPADPLLLRRFPYQLSGGQQQRMVLAGAMVRRPAVLVLDEPTTGLDSLHRRRVLDELAGLTRAGLALVLLTHDLAAVRELADQVVVLRRGHCCEAGPVAQVLAEPAHPYTRTLVAADQALRPVPAASAVPALSGVPALSLGRAGGGGGGLVVAGLSASYRRQPVVHGVDLRVPAGRCLAVVGPSGGGKSTLARCLAGLHAPDAGTVQVGGEPLPARLARRDQAQRRQVQYVFQDPHASFDPSRPVRDQVARTAVRLRGLAGPAARDEAEALLARMGVAAATAARRPAGLSGGELQRAALARALLAEPEVLVCDEVTSALDPPTQAAIMELLAGLAAARRLALVVISHDLAVVGQLADDLAVIGEGRLVESGPAAELLAFPRHPLTQALSSAL